MYLKELHLGHEAKCTCGSCKGTGVYKGFAEKEDLGVVCSSCNGTGFYTLKLDEQTQLVKDEGTGIVYVVEDGMIEGSVKLFDGLQVREDVKYVVYGTGRVFSPDYLFKHGATDVEVVRYSDFVNGKLPLPLENYTCPRFISQSYGNADFDNDCRLGLMSDCDKYGTQECWDKFYGDAKTVEEKQDVLRHVK